MLTDIKLHSKLIKNISAALLLYKTILFFCLLTAFTNYVT